MWWWKVAGAAAALAGSAGRPPHLKRLAGAAALLPAVCSLQCVPERHFAPPIRAPVFCMEEACDVAPPTVPLSRWPRLELVKLLQKDAGASELHMGNLTTEELASKAKEAHPELDKRKAPRTLKRMLSGGGALPGTEKDLYFPPGTGNRPPAHVWSFFRSRYSDKLINMSRGWCFVHDGDQPCPYRVSPQDPPGAVPRVGACTTELTRHLKRFHGMSDIEIERKATEKQWPPQGKHNQNVVVNAAFRKSRAAEAKLALQEEQQTRELAEGPQPKVFLQPLDQTISHRLNAMWARMVVIHDSRPTTTAESDGMSTFLGQLLRLCGATHKWEPASHQDVGHVLNEDLKSLAKQFQKVVPTVPREYMVLHEDVWEDRFKRHWIGASLCWLDEDLLPNCTLLAFEQLEKWADPWEGEGVHCSNVAARAISCAWNSHMGLEGVEFPVWNYSDNASPAVKVGKVLGCAQLRCAPHLLGILVLRILFNFDVAKKETQAPKPAAHPKLQALWEQMRTVGKYYHKHKDNETYWHKAREALDQKYVSCPSVDSHAKWDTSRVMAEEHCTGWEVTQKRVADDPKHPKALTDTERKYVEEQLPSLDVLHAACSSLQGNKVFAGELLPIITGLKKCWARHDTDMAKALLAEWDLLVERHLEENPCKGLPHVHPCRQLLEKVTTTLGAPAEGPGGGRPPRGLEN